MVQGRGEQRKQVSLIYGATKNEWAEVSDGLTRGKEGEGDTWMRALKDLFSIFRSSVSSAR